MGISITTIIYAAAALIALVIVFNLLQFVVRLINGIGYLASKIISFAITAAIVLFVLKFFGIISFLM